MIRSIGTFRECIERVRHLGGLHSALNKLTTNAIETTDILRAQIVMAVSAFDYYIHETVVIGMLEQFKDQRSKTSSFSNFKIPAELLFNSESKTINRLEAEIRDRHSFLSFQQPDKVADAIRIISDIKLWQEIGKTINKNDKEIKDQLKLIIDRRNKIAHEADVDPSYPGARWPITEHDIEYAINLLSSIAESIHTLMVEQP